jgi:hypothetical protein
MELKTNELITNSIRPENMPFFNLIVLAHAVLNSSIREISMSFLSPINQVQASIPVEIVAGVKAANGTATK